MSVTIYDMRPPKNCEACPKPKRFGKGSRFCDTCSSIDRVWSQFRENANGCWVWQGRTYKGYGKLGIDLTHRLAYEKLIGEIPAGLHLDHLCREKRCANPWHLEPVTGAENNKRRWATYTHCVKGHEFTDATTRLDKMNRRHCRPCEADSQRRYQARKRVTSS